MSISDASPEKIASPLSIKLNYALVAGLGLASLYYLSALSLVTSAVAMVAVAMAVLVYQRRRVGYIACAAACFGAFWLARTGQDFIGSKQVVMGLSLPVMIFALYLHEQFVPKNISDTDESADV